LVRERQHELSITLTRPGDTGTTSHSTATWLDQTANAQKVWTFQTNASSSPTGVALTFVQEAPGGPIKTQDTYTWGSDPVGRPFVSTVVSTLDSGTAAVTKQTVQTVDQYGNLLTQQVYNYGTAGSGSAGSLARTYTNTYLTDASGSGTFHPFYSTYGANYIFNRVTQSTVTD
jgi:hypothetical protein